MLAFANRNGDTPPEDGRGCVVSSRNFTGADRSRGKSACFQEADTRADPDRLTVIAFYFRRSVRPCLTAGTASDSCGCRSSGSVLGVSGSVAAQTWFDCEGRRGSDGKREKECCHSRCWVRASWASPSRLTLTMKRSPIRLRVRRGNRSLPGRQFLRPRRGLHPDDLQRRRRGDDVVGGALGNSDDPIQGPPFGVQGERRLRRGLRGSRGHQLRIFRRGPSS